MRTSHALLTAVVLTAGAATAWAQGAAPYDPSQLPAIQGKVAQYSLTPRGDVDGLILSDGTEVHMPPHLGTSLVFAVKPGDAVTIRGLKARAVPMIQAMEISNNATHATVTDTGPGGRGVPPMTAQGKVKTQLHGPRGELNGVLLTDGTIIHMPPPEAQRLAASLAPDASLYVSGMGYAGPLGRVIEARAIGPNANQLTQIVAPPPPPGPGPGGPGSRGPGPGGPGRAGGPPPPPPPGVGPAGDPAAPPPPPGAGPAGDPAAPPPPPGAGPAGDPAAPPPPAPGVGPAGDPAAPPPPSSAGPARDPAAPPPGAGPAGGPAAPQPGAGPDGRPMTPRPATPG